MSRADRDRWNAKYAAANPQPAFTPDPLLIEHAALLDGRGFALDLACGVGQNALFLAQHGYEVIAVDGSIVGLRYAREAIAAAGARVHLVAADLDQFVLPRDTFALVIVFRFLDRALIPKIKEALVPGGLVIYQTFNANRQRTAPHMSRAYLVELGELARLFEGFEVIATNDRVDNRDESSYWIGRRPATHP